MVALRKIDVENFERCIKLRVADDQKSFVASNLYSLAQAYVYPSCVPLGIYAEGEMVGFLMYGEDEEDRGRTWISRLMVDERFQRRGYGRAAMEQAIERIAQKGVVEGVLRISFEPDNHGAEALYQSLGFCHTGEIIEGEAVMELPIAERQS